MYMYIYMCIYISPHPLARSLTLSREEPHLGGVVILHSSPYTPYTLQTLHPTPYTLHTLR